MVGPFEFLTVLSSEMVPRLVAFLHLIGLQWGHLKSAWASGTTPPLWRCLGRRGMEVGRREEGGKEGGKGGGGGRRGEGGRGDEWEGEYEGERRGGKEMCINITSWSVAPLTLGHHDVIMITS